MALCESCAGINFDVSTMYEYREAGLDLTCLICRFMLRLMGFGTDFAGNRVYVWTSSNRLVLRRSQGNSNRVEVLVSGNTDGQDTLDLQDVKGRLRLCSTYGVERSLTCDMNAEQDELPGRLIAAHAEYEECFDVARGWLERCIRTHGTACALQTHAPFPTRLIHVPRLSTEPLRVKTTEGMTGQYVTLSYVWGQGTIFNTVRQNLQSRMDGFWPHMLPKTLRDAVKITRRLGFEWLWIDALCILQGDFDDWAHESALMASVYGNAVVTISADVSRDTDDGILRPRGLMRSPRFGPHEAFCFQELEGPWESLTGQHVYRRGWAFQERILSVRVLHFLEDQIAWECNTTIYREGFHGREIHTEEHFGKSQFTKQFHRKTPTMQETDVVSQIGAWNSMVQELVFRDFTVPADRFASISGIATALETPALGTYFAGVWEVNPFLSMGWWARYPQEELPEYRSPSWSWEWTHGQLMWNPAFCNTAISAADEAIWRAWVDTWGPRLLDRNIILESLQPKGRVLEGTSMTISGYCRYVFVEEEPGTEYEVCLEYDDDLLGMTAHPDRRPNDCEYKVWFDEGEDVAEQGDGNAAEQGDGNVVEQGDGIDAVQVDGSAAENGKEDVAEQSNGNFAKQGDGDGDGAKQQGDGTRATKYLCVQILRDRKPQDVNPKVFALLLTNFDEDAETYERAGIVAFDFDEGEQGKSWTKRTLKLV